jgi:hypothetical protein
MRPAAAHHALAGGGGGHGRRGHGRGSPAPARISPAARPPRSPPAARSPARVSGSIADPYLYDVYSILSVNGKVADVCKIHTGFRKAEFKGGAGTGGIWLNENFVWLTGYSQRAANDWPGLGSGVSGLDARLHRRAPAREQRQLHPLDAHFPATRVDVTSCDKYGITECLPGRRRRARCHRPPVGAAHGGHARLHDLFPQPPEHPFLGGGQLRNRRGRRWWQMVELRKKWDPSGGRVAGCRSLSDPGAVAATEYYGVMLGGPYSDQDRDHGPMIETEDFREEAARGIWDDFSPPSFGFKKGRMDSYNLNSETFSLPASAVITTSWPIALTIPIPRIPIGPPTPPSTGRTPMPTAGSKAAKSCGSAARWTACACPRKYFTPPA